MNAWLIWAIVVVVVAGISMLVVILRSSKDVVEKLSAFYKRRNKMFRGASIGWKLRIAGEYLLLGLVVIWFLVSLILIIPLGYMYSLLNKIRGYKDFKKIAAEKKAKKREYKKWLREHPNKFRDQPNGDLDPSQLSYIYFSRDLPFKPDDHQIIYFENKYDEWFNRYFRENEDEIRTFFRRNGQYDFVYVPTICDHTDLEAQNKYLHPSGNCSEIGDKRIGNSFLMRYFRGIVCRRKIDLKKEGYCISTICGEEVLGNLGPSLICWGHNWGFVDYPSVPPEGDNVVFSYYRLLPADVKPVERQIHDYFVDFHHFVLYHLEQQDADEKFDEGDAKIAKEIEELVDKLRQHGVREYVISGLFEKKEKLSRMVVTKDYRILLPDYQNMEIEMRALPKAVYLLFLKHPEGIVFKCLPDYREELTCIYNHLTNRSNDEDVKKSIDDVTNPLMNSINEKCARIRGAFVAHFADSLADNYAITGKRGEAKKITLPRELVSLECRLK
jgi:hypothetical protein